MKRLLRQCRLVFWTYRFWVEKVLWFLWFYVRNILLWCTPDRFTIWVDWGSIFLRLLFCICLCSILEGFQLLVVGEWPLLLSIYRNLWRWGRVIVHLGISGSRAWIMRSRRARDILFWTCPFVRRRSKFGNMDCQLFSTWLFLPSFRSGCSGGDTKLDCVWSNPCE